MINVRLRTLTVLLAAGAALAAAGCTTPVHVRNAAPLVTSISAAAAVDGGLRMLLWIQDHEEDPVDLHLGYVEGDSACDALRARIDAGERDVPLPDDDGALAGVEPIVLLPGNHHHASGLTTGQEFPGRAHEIDWDTAGIAAGTRVCIYALPDDREGGYGDPALSETFDVSAGL